MSFPAEGIESAYKNSIDDVRVYFDTKHPDHYVIINISQRHYNVSKLNDRVSLLKIFSLVESFNSANGNVIGLFMAVVFKTYCNSIMLL